MKKYRIFCMLLCLIFALQASALSCFAVNGEEETDSEQQMEETVEKTEKPIVAPPINQISGNAEISMGCKTIDAQKPMNSNDGLLKTAKAGLLYERNTGTLLYSKNPDEKVFPASLTKVMTCMLAVENLKNLDEIITVSESALEGMDPDGSSINLQPGEQMSVMNLLYGLMVCSANDAGAVLAERVAGSQAKFVDMMNNRAQQLGCVNTHFANAHGLHDENHYTTARDLARIMLAAVELPLFRQLDSTASYKIPGTNLSEEREIFTTNFMIGTDTIDTFYDERVSGGKTGFTTPAGRCLMCTAQDENTSLLSIVLGAQEEVMDDGYTVTYYGNFEETSVLLKFGFESFSKNVITMADQALQQFPVTDGKNAIAAGSAEEISAILPADYELKDITFQCELSDSSLKAPIERGEEIGVCRIWYKGLCIAQSDLVSLSESEYRVLGNDIFSDSELQRENLGKILKTAGIVFVALVLLLVLAAIVTGIRNAVIRKRRRRRRDERRRSR